jgi:hypothetical protein
MKCETNLLFSRMVGAFLFARVCYSVYQVYQLAIVGVTAGNSAGHGEVSAEVVIIGIINAAKILFVIPAPA